MLSDNHSLNSAIVTSNFENFPGTVEETFDGAGLCVVADLEEEVSAGCEGVTSVVDEAAKEVQAIHAAVQRSTRFKMGDLWLKLINLPRGDVGQVRDDDVDLDADCVEQIASDDDGSIIEPLGSEVSLRHRRRQEIDIDGEEAELPALGEQGEPDTPTAAANVDSEVASALIVDQLNGLLNEHFRIWSRHEHALGHLDIKRPELLVSREIGHGLAVAPSRDHLTKGLSLFLVERAIEIEVEPEPVEAEHVSEEHFSVESRRLDPSLGQVVIGPFEDFSDGPSLHLWQGTSERASTIPCAKGLMGTNMATSNSLGYAQ